MWSRRGHGGVEQIRGEGLIAAAFRHRTSRNGDPHLHTHVLVPNMVLGADGRWATLDARWLYTSAKTIGYLYEAQLRHNLTVALGVEWGPVTNGIADIAGVPAGGVEGVLDPSSEIEERMDIRGQHSPQRGDGRRARHPASKDHKAAPTDLRALWLDRARVIGFDPAQLASRDRACRDGCAVRCRAWRDRGSAARRGWVDRACVGVRSQRGAAGVVRRAAAGWANRGAREIGGAFPRPDGRRAAHWAARAWSGDQGCRRAGSCRCCRQGSGGQPSSCSTSNAAPSTAPVACSRPSGRSAMSTSPGRASHAPVAVRRAGPRRGAARPSRATARHRHRARRCGQDLRVRCGA